MVAVAQKHDADHEEHPNGKVWGPRAVELSSIVQGMELGYTTWHDTKDSANDMDCMLAALEESKVLFHTTSASGWSWKCGKPTKKADKTVEKPAKNGSLAALLGIQESEPTTSVVGTSRKRKNRASKPETSTAEDKIDKILAGLDSLGKDVGNITSRMDAFEEELAE
jgi:hypothetical protein